MGVLIWFVFLLHTTFTKTIRVIKKKNILLLFCASVLVLVASARPQTQLKWNWEEVILSRNGPSTTTTPRPTRWTTTPLRFLDIAPVVQSGSVGSVEDAYLVPRPRKRPRIGLENASSRNSGKNSIALMLVLFPVMLMWNF